MVIQEFNVGLHNVAVHALVGHGEFVGALVKVVVVKVSRRWIDSAQEFTVLIAIEAPNLKQIHEIRVKA